MDVHETKVLREHTAQHVDCALQAVLDEVRALQTGMEERLTLQFQSMQIKLQHLQDEAAQLAPRQIFAQQSGASFEKCQTMETTESNGLLTRLGTPLLLGDDSALGKATDRRAQALLKRTLSKQQGATVASPAGATAGPGPGKAREKSSWLPTSLNLKPEAAMKHRHSTDSIVKRVITTRALHNYTVRQGKLKRLVDHMYFDVFVATIILLNSLLLGLQTNHDAVSDSPQPWFDSAEYIFLTIFTSELLLRVVANQWEFLISRDKFWNLFDTTLVATSWMEFIMLWSTQGDGAVPGPGASMGKVIKIARTARIMRVLRMIRFLTSIRIMVMMIVGSLRSLLWLLLLLLAVMYIFALVLTRGATDWMKPDDDEPPVDDATYAEAQDLFGDLPRSMYTLFLAMTQGISWGEPAGVTKAFGWSYFLVFVLYVFFATFSILNIVTGVFVDSAIQQADRDRVHRMEKTRQVRREYATNLADLLMAMDADGNGYISKEEWDAALGDSEVTTMMRFLNIGGGEASNIWGILDVYEEGVLEIEELVQALMQFEGPAKSIDIHRLTHQVNTLVAQMDVWLRAQHGGATRPARPSTIPEGVQDIQSYIL